VAITRILFASDFHGSDLCFRKFLSAAKTHKCEVLIVGGDVTGKAIVPIVETGGAYEATIFDSTHKARNEREILELEKRISSIGFYPKRMSREAYETTKDDKQAIEKMFEDSMKQRLREWIQLAEEHLGPLGLKCYLMPGNDDIVGIDGILAESNVVMNPDGQVIEIDAHHEMAGLAFSNMTPWKCPRDIAEEELARKIDVLVSHVKDVRSSIFCFHVPPYNTNLDLAPELDKDLKIVHKGGQICMIPVGSTSVRAAIERYQPILGLHGHVHESRGFERIGRTLCLNAGSEYAEGILRAAIVNVDEKGVKGHLFISG